MDSPTDERAALLMAKVRDPAIRTCDLLASESSPDPAAIAWRTSIAGGPSRTTVSYVIPDVVDAVLFHLLDAIDAGELTICKKDGERLHDVCADGRGELAGWLMGSGGWRATLSSERHNDYFGDLELEVDWE